jgi:hypothetical protein
MPADTPPSWAVSTEEAYGSNGYNNHTNSPIGTDGPPRDEVADRTQRVADELKVIYKRAVLPVEKKYRYDYFFESPFMSDVEFDGKENATVCSHRMSTVSIFDSTLTDLISCTHSHSYNVTFLSLILHI